MAEFRIVPLLALLFIGASAAAPSAEDAARDARTAFDRAEYARAAQIVQSALQRYGSRNDKTIWTLRVLAGEVLLAQGENNKAREALKPELPAALRTSDVAVRRLVTLALAGDATHLREAQTIAAAHQPQMLGEVYRALASATADDAASEKYALTAIAQARRHGDRRSEAKTMTLLLFRYARAGRYQDAILWGEKALALAQALQLRKTISSAGGNLAWPYIELGDYEIAEELLTAANRVATDIGAQQDQVAWLIQLGNARAMQGDRASGIEHYKKAAGIARRLKHWQLGYALANLASLAVDDGRFEEARRFNAEALEVKRKTREDDAELRSMIIDARIDAGTGRFDAATRTLERVIAKTTNDTTRWEARGRLAETFAKAKRVDLADRQFQLAIQTVSDTRNAIDKELRLAFFNTSTDIFTAYLDFLFEQHRLQGALEATEIIRNDTLDDDLEVRARTSFADPRAIARQQNATILSYWLGPRRSWLWKITSRDVRVVQLAPEKKIRAAVDAYRRDLLGTRGYLSARGDALSRLLGIPTNLPRGSRVIVIADGNLHALNFETLIVPAPRRHYWIEDVNIMAASSVQLLAQRDPPPNRDPRMLLVGDPNPADPAFPRLPDAREEIARVANHFAPARRNVLTGAAATPAAYRAASPQKFDFVHFVAHGVATRRRPLESAVILGADATSNYRLVAREILKQPLRARLVTISSCHGAGTRAYTGEGLVGLAWAFLRAGASNVIAALWEVNDSATPQLMDDVYRAIGRGSDPATALREAKLELLRSNGAYKKPRYWAPFVLYAGR